MFHFEKERDRLGAVADVELLEQIAQVEFDRVDRNAKSLPVDHWYDRTQAPIAGFAPAASGSQRVRAHLADVDEGENHIARRDRERTSRRRSGGALLLTNPAPPSCKVSAGAAGSLVPL